MPRPYEPRRVTGVRREGRGNGSPARPAGLWVLSLAWLLLWCVDTWGTLFPEEGALCGRARRGQSGALLRPRPSWREAAVGSTAHLLAPSHRPCANYAHREPSATFGSLRSPSRSSLLDLWSAALLTHLPSSHHAPLASWVDIVRLILLRRLLYCQTHVSDSLTLHSLTMISR